MPIEPRPRSQSQLEYAERAIDKIPKQRAVNAAARALVDTLCNERDGVVPAPIRDLRAALDALEAIGDA